MDPGDYVPSRDSQAVRLADVERCEGCGTAWRDGDARWHRSFQTCVCVRDGRGHWTWTHRCGWSLTVPPHDEGMRVTTAGR